MDARRRKSRGNVLSGQNAYRVRRWYVTRPSGFGKRPRGARVRVVYVYTRQVSGFSQRLSRRSPLTLRGDFHADGLREKHEKNAVASVRARAERTANNNNDNTNVVTRRVRAHVTRDENRPKCEFLNIGFRDRRPGGSLVSVVRRPPVSFPSRTRVGSSRRCASSSSPRSIAEADTSPPSGLARSPDTHVFGIEFACARGPYGSSRRPDRRKMDTFCF